MKPCIDIHTCKLRHWQSTNMNNMKNCNKLVKIFEIYKIMNNFLITGKLPCHTENLHITPKQEKLIL